MTTYRWPFTVAHAVPDQVGPTVSVYRTSRHYTLGAALKRAGHIRRAGYLAWIERTGSIATQ